MIAALSGGLMKQNPCPHVASSWLAPAVQAASLLCSRIRLSSAFPFISACSEGSSLSLPLFAVWLCLFSLLSRSPLIRLWVLYSCSLGWAEREIDCSQFSSRLNCIDLSPIHADEELCYLLITTAIPSRHQLNGWVCAWECGGSYGLEESLWGGVGIIIFFPDQSGPLQIGGLVLVGQWGNPRDRWSFLCLQWLFLEESLSLEVICFP